MIDEMVYWTAILCIAIPICMARELIDSWSNPDEV